VTVTPREILDFWADTVGETRWYVVEPALDDEIRTRYLALWREARDGKLSDWERTAEGALALLIVLDQFPRNMFRGKADTFSTDPQALAVADRAIAQGFDRNIDKPIRQFFYLPFEHSENMADQDRSVALFGERMGKDDRTFPYAMEHRAEIERFGRFPSRNAQLGRTSTPEEAEFLRRKA